MARAIETLDPDRVDTYVLSPDLALPAGLEPLVASGKLRFVDEVDYAGASIVHLSSVVELAIPLDRLLPRRARTARLRLVTTAFDLIPLSRPGDYLEDPGLARRYRSRIEVFPLADQVIAISAFTAAEFGRHLGVSDDRLHVVPLAASPAFGPAASRDAALRAARLAVPGLAERFVLYPGGSDRRKNVETLLEAWAQLPAALRDRWQLVLQCHLEPPQRNHFEVRAAKLGIRRFLATGYVDEATLVVLNQSAGLVVFPSLIEGFGLPVAEALACHTPAIGSDRTSVAELLPEEAQFDPTDPNAIAAAIVRGLSDDDMRRRNRVWAHDSSRTWIDVARETLGVYDIAARRAPRAPGRSATVGGGARAPQPRLALVTPVPPQSGGVADYSARLLPELRRFAAVDLFVDGPPHERPAVLAACAAGGEAARPLATLERVEAMSGEYDEVVYAVGNSEYHTGAVATLSRRPGAVLAHDVRLTNLYHFAQWQHPEACAGGFHPTLQRMYDGLLPPDLGAGGRLSDDEADRWGISMAREVVAASTRYFATSPFAAELARLDARAADRAKITTVPFGIVSTTHARDHDPASPWRIASFGVVNERKQWSVLVDALVLVRRARNDARLDFVGHASADQIARIRAHAEAAGVEGAVGVTGGVDAHTYECALCDASVAVQLRASTNGESSAAVGDCLGAGLPTVVTAIGASRSLPPDAVITVPPAVTADELAGTLIGVLRSRPRRELLSTNARAHAEASSFAVAARMLVDALRLSPAQ